jgi:putative tricarboxylic transport membrane protein
LETLGLLFDGFLVASTGYNLLFCLIGVTVGMVVGVMPGIGPVAGTALLIPITYSLEPTTAIIMLSGIFYGCMYGGTITSVLINVPGESASVITCIDGHELAKQGRAGVALGVAGIGSFFGGIVAILALVFVGPPIARYALKFGPPEYFALMMFGLLMLNALVGKSLTKGLMATCFGMFLATVGQEPISGVIRFSFGISELISGIDFVVIAMGLFGVSEILESLGKESVVQMKEKITTFLPRKEEMKDTAMAIVRGTGVGMFLGLVPGASAVISSIISYAVEKKVAKDPTRFGKGAIEGIAGPETANNAHAGAAMIPLFTLGIPSSATVALLLGAFVMHGLTPGPALFQKNPEFVWGVIASMFIGNVILLVFNLPMANYWAKIILVPYKLLYPLILIVTMIGAFSISNSFWNVGVMLIFGVIGYILKKLEFPLAAITLSFVLGTQIELTLLQSLSASDKGMLIFFTRPISGTIMALCIGILLFSIISRMRKAKYIIESEDD